MKLRILVGAVLVVVALIALKVVDPRRLKVYECRFHQRDATSTLKEIRSRISTNLGKGDPAGSFGDLAWYPKTDAYQYDIAIGFSGRFDVTARARNLNGDVWQIDENGTLINKVDGCRGLE